MRWVKAKKYYELSGETKDSVRHKRESGHFIDGIHTKIAEDGNLWVNLEAVEQWVENGKKSVSRVV